MTAERFNRINNHLAQYGMLPEEYAEELLKERDALTARVAELERRAETAEVEIGELAPKVCDLEWQRDTLKSELAAARKVEDGEIAADVELLETKAHDYAAFDNLAWDRIKGHISKLSAALKEWQTLAHGAALECEQQKARAQAAETKLESAYSERNKLVAFLAHCYPAAIARTAIEGWDPEWHWCVYINTPAGQMSWHYHDSDAHLFDDLPLFSGQWDGHTTEQKYDRLRALQTKDTTP